MNPDLLARYDGLRVPRYTSYPTAPHFGAQVDADVYRGWLGQLEPTRSLSLYLHVPFCHAMCWYCGCHTKIVARYEPVASYLAALEREVDLVADALPGRFTVRHIHWGGGTPTYAAPEDFERIMTRLRARFDLAGDAEIAVEIDPRTFSDAMAATLGRTGVNRASLGIQDFDPEVQKAVNRIQPLADSERTLAALRANGIEHINFDLMYGLPLQTEETCRRSAEIALTLRPDRLSVFGYAHVPWMKTHQKMIAESGLPGSRDRWSQFAAIAEVLTGNGFQAIGLDHFARDDDELAVAHREGRLYRNFQGYTTDDADVLIGFGASSIGSLPQGYIQNAPSLSAYAEAITAGRPATAKGLALQAEDRVRRDLIMRLMGDLTVDIDAVAARHGVDAATFDPDLEKLGGLIADGVAQVDGRRVTVPESARPLVRIAASVFDTYLAKGAARHSTAI